MKFRGHLMWFDSEYKVGMIDRKEFANDKKAQEDM